MDFRILIVMLIVSYNQILRKVYKRFQIYEWLFLRSRNKVISLMIRTSYEKVLSSRKHTKNINIRLLSNFNYSKTLFEILPLQRDFIYNLQGINCIGNNKIVQYQFQQLQHYLPTLLIRLLYKVEGTPCSVSINIYACICFFCSMK